MRIVAAFASFLLTALASPSANAAVRAWLDRDHVALGDHVILTIASNGSQGKPDLSALQKDFEVLGIAAGMQERQITDSDETQWQWSVGLQPKHAGVVEIPAIALGSEKTPPLRVSVSAADTSATASANPKGDAPVFIEDSVEPTSPHVREVTIFKVRLYFAGTPQPGSDLEVPPPANTDMRQIGGDVNDSVMLHGHRYDVLERRYLLQPDRSGAMRIPAPTFQGVVGDEDETRMQKIQAEGKPMDLQVRPVPPGAGEPWLPARSIVLEVEPIGPKVHAGEPFTISVAIRGVGVRAEQLPEISFPASPDVQVYPEPSSTREMLRDGNIVAERTRRFAVVPERVGDVRMPDLTIPWWDVINDRAALARLAMPTLRVAPGTPTKGAIGQSNAASGSASAAESRVVAREVRTWQAVAAVLAALLLVSLVWGGRRRRVAAPDEEGGDVATQTPRGAPALATALERGVPAAIVQALLDAAARGTPHEDRPRHLAEVARRLEDAAQHDAVLALDASRWRAGGDPVQAVARMREAFARPPRWRVSERFEPLSVSLPPLYPP